MTLAILCVAAMMGITGIVNCVYKFVVYVKQMLTEASPTVRSAVQREHD